MNLNQNFERAIIQIIENNLCFDLANYSPQIKSIQEEWQKFYPQENYPKIVLWEFVALDAMPDIEKERKLNELYF